MSSRLAGGFAPDGSRSEDGPAAVSRPDDADLAVDPAEDTPADGLPGDSLTEAQIEALLFVAERPLSRREIGIITGARRETVDARLGDLEVALAGRGIRLLVDGERVALATAPETGPLIARYVGREPTRLSPTMLETLAIVAYRQPVTRAAIERIRGVDAEYAIRGLLHRRLVVELGRADAPGRPLLYGTSFDFLERFGLTSLDELPHLDAAAAAHLAGDGPVAGDGPEADTTEGGAAEGGTAEGITAEGITAEVEG